MCACPLSICFYEDHEDVYKTEEIYEKYDRNPDKEEVKPKAKFEYVSIFDECDGSE